MSLRDLTDPAAVHSAMSTYDEMGREQFLAEYGFGPAQKYWLVHEGRYYDSKAIVGVAHLHQTGALLSGSDFTGGLSGAVRILKALGFGVVTNDEETSSNEGPPSFELLWNPHNWSWDDAEFQATRKPSPPLAVLRNDGAREADGRGLNPGTGSISSTLDPRTEDSSDPASPRPRSNPVLTGMNNARTRHPTSISRGTLSWTPKMCFTGTKSKPTTRHFLANLCPAA